MSSAPLDDQYVGYDQWGVDFFTRAVSVDRVLSGVNVLAGQQIDVGPMGVGPGRLVKVTAQGAIGEASGERIAQDPVTFRVLLPVDLTFTIDLGMDKQTFLAEITIPLLISARARRDLAIILDIAPPRAHEVEVNLQAQGIRASITQHAANVEGELKRFAAKYVAREVDKPYVRAARTIDVSGAIDKAMRTLGPRRPEAGEMTSDLPDALAEEIRAQEDLFTDSDPETDSETPPTPA